VTVTDLKEIQCLLMKNVADNLTSINGHVECRELNWSDHELVGNRFGKKDVIFIADCIYYEEVNSLIRQFTRQTYGFWVLNK
jgi:hypothetical protein